MTRIDFYQIDSGEALLLFTCRLIEKVYRRGLQIYIHTISEKQSEELDDLLWSFRRDRFIPHLLQASEGDAPIRIGHNHEPEDHQEMLINLSSEVPDFFSRFDRVAEIVPQGKDNREAARQHYQFYKQRGYSLQYHEMKQGAKVHDG